MSMFNPLQIFEALGIGKRKSIAVYSKISKGKDMGDSGYGDDVDCMVSVFNIILNSTGLRLGDRLSTYRTGRWLKWNPRWREIPIWKAEESDLVICPTQGNNIGHIFIAGEFDPINKYPQTLSSNNSDTGLWDSIWTIGSAYNYYVYKKKLLMKVYRLIL